MECAKGTYQPQPGQTSCIQCPGGKVTDHTGSTSADECKTYAKCPPGEYNAVDGYTPCTQCDVGYYSTDPGATSCQKCSGGFSTKNKGSTSPKDCTEPPKTEPPTSGGSCAPGYFSASGSEPCDPCPLNEYAKGYGSKACTKCPEGQVTDAVASEEPGDCHEKAEKQTGLSTGTFSVIGVIAGIVVLVSLVVILLFIRHRKLNAGSNNRLVLSDTATAGTSGGYGTGAEAPRGFMNPMYDDPTERTDPIELSETSHGVLNPTFSSSSDV
jgi:hypothetical protein